MNYGEKQKKRREILGECIIQAIGNITINSIQSHISHSMSFLPNAIRMIDI